MIYYAADLHFHYLPIVEGRGFSSAAEMDETIIKNWNETVTDEDTVYLVGDVGYNDNHVPVDALSRLKGHKHLIRGNHDTGFVDAELLYNYFETITDFNEIEDGDDHVILCHYPIVHNKRSYMIHGHLHMVVGLNYEVLKMLPQVLNATLEINDYRPVTLSQLKENNYKFFNRCDEDFKPFEKRKQKPGMGQLPAKPDFKPIPKRPD